MSVLDDLAEAVDSHTPISRLSALSGSPWSDVREVVARNPRLPLYLLHRLAEDPNLEVSTAACRVIVAGSVTDIRAALRYNPSLTRAVLRAGVAHSRGTNTFAMPRADFDKVMVALNVNTLNEHLDQMPRHWLVVLAEPDEPGSC